MSKPTEDIIAGMTDFTKSSKHKLADQIHQLRNPFDHLMDAIRLLLLASVSCLLFAPCVASADQKLLGKSPNVAKTESFLLLISNERLEALQKQMGSGFASGKIFEITNGKKITAAAVRAAILPAADKGRFLDGDILKTLVNKEPHLRYAAISALFIRNKAGPRFKWYANPLTQKEIIRAWCKQLSQDFDSVFKNFNWEINTGVDLDRFLSDIPVGLDGGNRKIPVK